MDFRSDTVTKPTARMRAAMAEAVVGDDDYGEDPTVHALEEFSADLLHMPQALFMPSGTMANQVAVLAQSARGDEVLVEARAHIYVLEAGSLSFLAGVQPRPLAGERGVLDPQVVRRAFSVGDLHCPATRLLCLENTHNLAGGRVSSVAETAALVAEAHRLGLRVHLDGARLFNAAAHLQVEPHQLCAGVDSAMFCLSKGLGAPVGSVLLGSHEMIEQARKHRKRLGGGMRQAGVLAAAGLVALAEMRDRLVEDHVNAKHLAKGLAEVPGFQVDAAEVQTNIVMADVPNAERVVQELARLGILTNALGASQIRFVTHVDVGRKDVEQALDLMASRVKVGDAHGS